MARSTVASWEHWGGDQEGRRPGPSFAVEEARPLPSPPGCSSTLSSLSWGREREALVERAAVGEVGTVGGGEDAAAPRSSCRVLTVLKYQI